MGALVFPSPQEGSFLNSNSMLWYVVHTNGLYLGYKTKIAI